MADFLNSVRRLEGFTPRAQWDYKQHSNGYGTRAQYPGEVIDRGEAERRLQSEIAKARTIVDQYAPNADEGTKAALTSLTFNAGADWVNSGLGQAVRSGDLETARSRFVQYVNAGGSPNAGLAKRRGEEAQWIGNPTAFADRPSPSAITNPAEPATDAAVLAPVSAQVAPETPSSVEFGSFSDEIRAAIAKATGLTPSEPQKADATNKQRAGFDLEDDAASPFRLPPLPRQKIDLRRLRAAFAARSGGRIGI